MESRILNGIQNTMQNPIPEQQPIDETPVTLFDVDNFISTLAKKSHDRNMMAHYYSNNINSYDIAHNCIRETVFRIQNYPLESYTDMWLPIKLRSTLGNAIHDFIQSNDESFTEIEVSLKAPSVRASARSDALINNNVLVEIKSCTYKDYLEIIKTSRPRNEDFCQTMYNRYLLHNHLQEIKQQTTTRTPPPKLDYYNIGYIQLVYVAHDTMSAECNSMSECVNAAKEVKQILQSRVNPFHFITSITLDLSLIDLTPYENYITAKLKTINYYLDNSLIPPMNDNFVNTKHCYFCLYKKLCAQQGGGK